MKSTLPSLCPICRKHAAAPEFKPFCSTRCADEDLLSWLKGAYVLPGEENVSADTIFTNDEAEHSQ